MVSLVHDVVNAICSTAVPTIPLFQLAGEQRSALVSRSRLVSSQPASGDAIFPAGRSSVVLFFDSARDSTLKAVPLRSLKLRICRLVGT